MQVDESDVPVIKLTILDAEVLWNPYDDLQPRVDKEEKKAAREEAEALAKVRLLTPNTLLHDWQPGLCETCQQNLLDSTVSAVDCLVCVFT